MEHAVLSVRMQKELYEIVIKEAKRQKVTPSDYARGAIAVGLLMDGNSDILRLAGKNLGTLLTEKLKEACSIEGVKVKA